MSVLAAKYFHDETKKLLGRVRVSAFLRKKEQPFDSLRASAEGVAPLGAVEVTALEAAVERRRQALLGCRDAMTELKVANDRLVVQLLAEMGFCS